MPITKPPVEINPCVAVDCVIARHAGMYKYRIVDENQGLLTAGATKQAPYKIMQGMAESVP